jgi:serine/threonine protein kinase
VICANLEIENVGECGRPRKKKATALCTEPLSSQSANIGLTSELTAKMLDYGMARPTANQAGHLRSQYMVGTPGYIAPEVVSKATTFDQTYVPTRAMDESLSTERDVLFFIAVAHMSSPFATVSAGGLESKYPESRNIRALCP